MLAVLNDFPQMVRALIEAGANLEITNASGKTALDLAHWMKHEEIIELLTRAGDTARKNSSARSS